MMDAKEQNKIVDSAIEAIKEKENAKREENKISVDENMAYLLQLLQFDVQECEIKLKKAKYTYDTALKKAVAADRLRKMKEQIK